MIPGGFFFDAASNGGQYDMGRPVVYNVSKMAGVMSTRLLASAKAAAARPRTSKGTGLRVCGLLERSSMFP